MAALRAEGHFALGNLAKKAGEQRSAREQFSTVVSKFRKMGMRSWLEKTESSLKILLAK